jgi:ssDNA-binding Zn-finger/Zn-ribbon topoisomerase 1
MQCQYFDRGGPNLCAKGHSLKHMSMANMPCWSGEGRKDCPDRKWLTRDKEAERATEAEIDAIFEMAVDVRAKIEATGRKQGEISCPKCGRPLRFAFSEYNGHLHACCTTPGCFNWRE